MKTTARMARWVLGSVVFFLSFTVAAQFGPAPVNVTEAKISEIYPTAWVSGSVISNNDAQIASEVNGRLVFVAEVGERVTQGQVIARIDQTIHKLQVDEAKALVSSAKSNHQFLVDEVKRQKGLAKQNLASKNELERTVNDRDMAKARLSQEQVKLHLAMQRMEFTTIKAPFDGVVTSRLSQLGEVVSNGTQVIQLVETVNLEISAQVPLTVYEYLMQGTELEVKTPLGDSKATVKAVVPVADARSHLMELRLALGQSNWPVGLNVRVAVPNGPTSSQMVVPRDAVVLRRGGNAIFRINAESQAERVAVTLGAASGGLIAIEGKVNEGDKIVIRGSERLQPGQKVMIKDNNDALVSVQGK